MRRRFTDASGGAGKHGQALVIAVRIKYAVDNGFDLAENPEQKSIYLVRFESTRSKVG
jgi:hypothetical protein